MSFTKPDIYSPHTLVMPEWESTRVDMVGEPLTGYRCCVCFEYAQVLDSGQSFCVKHAKQWNHGNGMTLEHMSLREDMLV